MAASTPIRRDAASQLLRRRHCVSRDAVEESEHRRALIDLCIDKFGEHIPLVRRADVRGFLQRTAIWQVQRRGLDAMREQAQRMELEISRFYRRAAGVSWCS